MSKKKTTPKEVIEISTPEIQTPVVETTPTVEQSPIEIKVTKQLGRPVDPSSVRQKRIMDLETRRANGELKRGRPIVQGCKRQEVLMARAAKVASGIELKRGRPINPESKRQLSLTPKTVTEVTK